MNFRSFSPRRVAALTALSGALLISAPFAQGAVFAEQTAQAEESAQDKQTAQNRQDKGAAVAALRKGVASFPPVGLPGPVATFGENAFPVVVGEYDGTVLEPVVAASFVKKGRVVAFGHPDYIVSRSFGAGSSPNLPKIFLNSIRWASGLADEASAKKTPDGKIRVAVWKNAQTAEFLRARGFDAVSVDAIPEEKAFDVFVADAVHLNDEQYETLFKAIRGGAGFVTSGLGWGWSQLNPGKNLVSDHAGNRNFAKFNVGIAWTDGSLRGTQNGEFETGRVFSPFVDGSKTIEFVEKLAADGKGDFDSRRAALQAELADWEVFAPNSSRQISSTASLIYRFLPKKRRAAFDALATAGADEIVPTRKNPVESDDLIRRLTVAIQLDRYFEGQHSGETDAKDVPAFAAANDFPGPVPADAPRLNAVKISAKTAVPEWRSTGLYAAPGETITVKIDAETLKKLPAPPKIRIGAHSDELWKLAKWERYPKIAFEKTIKEAKTTVANPFGGAIFVVVPHNAAQSGLETIDVEISGAVEAPLFVRDETPLDEWRDKIRNAPAPWAELQGKNIVLSVPSSVIRDLNDPQALMETWDEILDLIAEFSSTPKDRVRPERMCCDRQISAGYMHSGYPAMTGMDVERVFVDRERLRTKGDWGFFHELGHNHQSRHWTFDGSTEVTVNYFTLYVMEKLCGLEAGEARGELKKEARLDMLRQYWSYGGSFDIWKQNPFLALNMTVQLRDEFGWEPIIATIAEYCNDAQNELPKNDDEKRDQWMTRLSRQVGKNLGPFFEKWGVPTSQAARDSLSDLPVWLPSEFDEVKK